MSYSLSIFLEDKVDKNEYLRSAGSNLAGSSRAYPHKGQAPFKMLISIGIGRVPVRSIVARGQFTDEGLWSLERDYSP
jgi:hypothetical protein